MDHTATLNDLASAEIAILQSEGINPTPAEVVELNALGWAVQTPETRRLLSRGRPVQLGTAWLWPLTLRAYEWLERNEVPMTSVSPAMGYAMAHGRSDGPELDCEGRTAEKVVRAWVRSLRATQAEFVEAVRQVDEQDARPTLPPDPDGKPMTVGDFSAFLTATNGADADFWERRCSMSYCSSVLTMFVMQNRADRKQCAQDPRIIAERALGYALDRIRKAHAAEVPRG